ncbi:MAG: hypothetical protein HYV97_19985 [Bdellovibrio sp.]|nr:hypothetical protein [Bdellovibrio sp.]
MKTLKDILLISILSIVLMQCANEQKKELEAEKAKLNIDIEEDISSRIDKMIQEAEWPTAEQKKKLFELKLNTKNKIIEVNQQLKKTKILLVQNLIIKGPTTYKLRLLKKEFKKMHKQKIEIMLDAIEEARKLLGKGNQVSQLDSMYHHFLLDER